jgi:hypothetical protein
MTKGKLRKIVCILSACAVLSGGLGIDSAYARGGGGGHGGGGHIGGFGGGHIGGFGGGHVGGFVGSHFAGAGARVGGFLGVGGFRGGHAHVAVGHRRFHQYGRLGNYGPWCGYGTT